MEEWTKNGKENQREGEEGCGKERERMRETEKKERD